MDIIKINQLNFHYGKMKIIDNLDLNVEQGEWLSIVGPNGSGKSTLIRILIGLLEVDSDIIIDDLILNKENIMEIRKIVGVIFENPNNQFIGATVRDDIAFGLENLNIHPQDIIKKIDKVAKSLDIDNLLDKEPHKLSGGEKQKVILASILVLEPKIIILDEALAMIDPIDKEGILKLLKKINKKQKITIINATNDLEDTLYGDRIVVLKKGSKLLEGKTIEILIQDKILTRLGLELPFMIDLSIKLKFYNLIDEVITDMDQMINILWK